MSAIHPSIRIGLISNSALDPFIFLNGAVAVYTSVMFLKVTIDYIRIIMNDHEYNINQQGDQLKPGSSRKPIIQALIFAIPAALIAISGATRLILAGYQMLRGSK